MGMNIQNNPKIRFNNFTYEWESKPLSNFFKKINEKGNENLEFITVLENFTQVRLLSAQGYGNDLSDQAKLKAKRIKENDFLVDLSTFERGIYMCDKEGLTSNAYTILRGNNQIFNIYWKYYFIRHSFVQSLKPITPPGARQGKMIEVNKLLFFKYRTPNINEQQKIGSFFKELDSLITLQQQKLEQLSEVKKVFLNKMFPRGKEVAPEYRFDGFADAWEQRKLEDISNNFEYGLNAAAVDYDGQHKYLRITDIDEDTRLFKQDDLTSPNISFENNDNYILSEGDILFARTGASVGKSYLYNVSDGLVYYAGFLIRARINEEFDNNFIFQNTLTGNYERYIEVTSQRSGQPGVNAKEFQNFPFLSPKVEEQRQIGSFFKQLDNLITLHQRKLEKLKLMKKYFLKNMFV